MHRLNSFILFLQNEKNPNNINFALRNAVIGVLVTGILMWSYLLNSYLVVEDHLNLRGFCVFYCLVHFFAPFAYRIYPSVTFVTNLFLAPGIAFQFHHSMATGGFYSSTPIWFSVIPLLAGILTNKKNMFFWFFISTALFFSLIYLDSVGVNNTVVSGPYSLWNHINIGMGYMLINVLLIWAYIDYRDRRNKVIEAQRDSIRNLLRILSHDINNPLSVIRIGTGLILKKSEDSVVLKENEIKLLKSNLDAVNNIISMTEYCKNFDAISSGKFKLNLQKIKLCEVLQESIEIFKFQADEKGVQLEVKSCPDDLYIMADKTILKNQVFNNLLSNALKFTDKDHEISIEVKSVRDEVEILFIDTGVGIHPDKLPSIFDEHIQTSTKGTNGETGTGFGLPIVKSIIEKLDARISVESRHILNYPDSHGTQFKINIKRAP